jgi:CubicO group peptidase (beta-lactamase class C family)
MGAEQDAYYTVDFLGTPYAGGGFNAGLRDMARIDELMLEGGPINGKRLVPKIAIDHIRAGGDKTAFAKAGCGLLNRWSYSGMWWTRTMITARSWHAASTGKRSTSIPLHTW